MTTKEFVKRVEELGFLVRPGAKNTVIYTLGDEKVVAVVGSVEPMIVENDCSGWRYYGSLELFDLMYEYARTPIIDRKEPKKYYLKAEWHYPEDDSYLNHYPGTNRVFLYGIEEIHSRKTKFTEAEIENLPDWCQSLTRIEVTDD